MPHFVSQANVLKQQELEANKAMDEIASMDEQQCKELFTDFAQLEGKSSTNLSDKKKKKKNRGGREQNNKKKESQRNKENTSRK